MTASPSSPASAWPTVLLSVAIIPIVAVVGALCILCVQLLGAEGAPLGGDRGRLLVQLLPAQLTLLGVAWWVARRRRDPVAPGLGLVAWRGGAAGLALGVVGCLALSASADAFASLAYEEVGGSLARLVEELRAAQGGDRALLIFWITVPPAFAEEIFYRGIIQRRVRAAWGPGRAIAVSTLAFALVHMDPIQSPLVLPLGAWLGWLAYRTGSVWPGILAHGANNLVASVGAASGGAVGGAPAAVAWLAGGLVAACACGWGLWWFTARGSPRDRSPTSSSDTAAPGPG